MPSCSPALISFNWRNNLCVWTSKLIRTQQTAQQIVAPKISFRQLNEINAGEHDGMTYEDIAEQFPVDFAARDRDKLRYRYPSGESYVDVCERLRDLLVVMNQSDNLLVISHQAVIRCIVAYLKKLPIEKLPYEKIPLHTLLKVTFDGNRNTMERNHLHVECVDTHRPKPLNCGNDRKFDDAIQTVPLHL
jgi:broad specificity phosphatase PhoE